MTDPVTGAFVLQLTAAQNSSTNLYFEHQSFLNDDTTVIFLSQRYPGRGAPSDLFRANDDGTNLTQLTDEAHPLGHPIPAWDERLIYGVRGNALMALDPDTFEATEVARCQEVTGLGACTLSGDGAYFLGCGTLKSNGKTAVVPSLTSMSTSLCTSSASRPSPLANSASVSCSARS